MWKWNRAEVPQVQHGSTVLPTAQGWKNAQLLWKVPKPRRSSRCWLALGYRLGCCRGSDLCSQYRAGLLFFFCFHQSSPILQEEELLGSLGFHFGIWFFFFFSHLGFLGFFFGFFSPTGKTIVCYLFLSYTAQGTGHSTHNVRFLQAASQQEKRNGIRCRSLTFPCLFS